MTHLRRHAREALRPGKVVDRDRVEVDVALLLDRLIRVAPLGAGLALHAVGQPALQVALGRRAEARERRLRRSGRSRGRHEAVQLAHRWKGESFVSGNIVVSRGIRGVPGDVSGQVDTRKVSLCFLLTERSPLSRKRRRSKLDFRKVRGPLGAR